MPFSQIKQIKGLIPFTANALFNVQQIYYVCIYQVTCGNIILKNRSESITQCDIMLINVL